jgi:putative aminopeptidase FrvX
MNLKFQETLFLDLLTKLMTVPGPSLDEGPRLQFIKKQLEESGVPFRTDVAGNMTVEKLTLRN